MVETLYSFGTRMQTVGTFAPFGTFNLVRPDFSNLSLSLLLHQGRSIIDDTSQDVVQNPVGLCSSFSTVGLSSSLSTSRPEPGVATQRHSHGDRLDPTQKFLYCCYPSKSDRNLDQVTVSSVHLAPTDKELIGDIKKQYLSGLSHLTRLKSLRGFSAIRLARVGPSCN